MIPMKKLFYILIRAAIVFAVIFATTYGWRPSANPKGVLTEEQLQIKTRLERHVDWLVNRIGPRNYENYANLNKAADYILREFNQLGYETAVQTYEAQGLKFRNIIASRPGFNDKSFIIIGAHYDTCFNPGADDNASGIAGVLEIARGLKNEQLGIPVKFIAFVNEEPPFFSKPQMGSRQYVSFLEDREARVEVAIIFDMLGYYSDKNFSQRHFPFLGPFYPNQGNFIAFISDYNSRRVMRELVKNFKSATPFPVEGLAAPSQVPGINFSDHSSFWAAGYRAVMVTDTAYMRNKNYHRLSDMPATLNFEKMAVVVAGLKDMVKKISQDSGVFAE